MDFQQTKNKNEKMKKIKISTFKKHINLSVQIKYIYIDEYEHF